MSKKITVILVICLILSMSFNIYLYYNPRYVEKTQLSPVTYVSLHKENITAYEKHHNVTVDSSRNPPGDPAEWNDTVEVFNPDLNTSFRFKYDSEMFYGFVETPYFGYHNCTLTLYFNLGNNATAVIIKGRHIPGIGSCGLPESTFISTYNRSNGLWEDEKPFTFEARIFADITSSNNIWSFEFAFPLNLIGSPTAGSSIGLAYSFYDKDDNMVLEWGNPDDFSTYTTLMFR